MHSFERQSTRERLPVISLEECQERFTLDAETCRTRVQAYKEKHANDPSRKWGPIEDRFRGFVKLSPPGEGQMSPDAYAPMDIFLTDGVLLDAVSHSDEAATVLTEAVFGTKPYSQTDTNALPEPQGYVVKIKIPASFQERHGIVCDGSCQTLEEALANPSNRDDASQFWDPERESEEYAACLARIVEERLHRGVLQIALANDTLNEGVFAKDRAQQVHRRATELLKVVYNSTDLKEAMAKVANFATEFAH